MPCAQLDHANLSGANLQDVNLSGAHIQYSDLSDANIGADLPGAFFLKTELCQARFLGADLSGARILKTVTGLTQAQLDTARADPDNPPTLDGVLDAETGKPLVWRGRPVDSQRDDE